MNRDEAIDIIRDAGFGFLATTEGNQPHVRPMMPYYTEDGLLLVALLGRSRTISEIQIPWFKFAMLTETCRIAA